MTKTIEQLKATILELFAELETKPQAKSMIKPVLETGQRIYAINGWGEAESFDYDPENLFQSAKLSLGSVFLNMKDLEDELKYRKLCYKLLKYTRGVDWGNLEQKKWGCWYNHSENIIEQGCHNKTASVYQIYFPTEEAREAAIKELTNDEWKFYFGYISKAVVL